MNPANIFNEKRRIIFATIHDKMKGFSVAEQYLESYKAALGKTGYAGLKAEMEFYLRFSREFGLTLAADVGEHVDFTGMIGGKNVRFDVTTNINFKEFKTYERFLCEGYDYKIAFFDKTNFEMIDVLDLAFPHCAHCGAPHAFPFLITFSDNLNRRGESTWTNDQLLADICPACSHFEERRRFTHYGLQPISSYTAEIDEEYFDVKIERDKYAANLYSFAKKLAPVELMGIGEPSYNITEKDGGGEWGLRFPVKSGVVDRHMPIFLETGQLE
jgi:hypothetical protein